MKLVNEWFALFLLKHERNKIAYSTRRLAFCRLEHQSMFVGAERFSGVFTGGHLPTSQQELTEYKSCVQTSQSRYVGYSTVYTMNVQVHVST